MNRSSATPPLEAKDSHLLDQLPQIIADKTGRNLHYSKCTVTRLGDMTDTQNIWIQLLKLLTKLIRWWRFKIWWKWVAVGHRRGKKSQEGGDVLCCISQSTDKTSKVLEPGRLVWRRCRIVGEVAGGISDESQIVQDAERLSQCGPAQSRFATPYFSTS